MPDRPEDVDEAFARLIAGFNAPTRADESTPWPESENVNDNPDDGTPTVQQPLLPPPPTAPGGADALDTPATWEDEGHFVPPNPPPLPWPAPLRLAAWVGVLVGPVVLTVVAALGWWVPDIVTTVLVVGFVSGVIYLIATMGAGPHDPYGPDNGAVV